MMNESKLTVILFSLLLFFVIKSSAQNGQKCSWDNCPKWKKGVINVHIFSHTHDDLGWIKSVDDYYTGARKDLAPYGVQFILNSVIEELSADPRRRFSYAETGFLKRWLENQPPAKVKRFHELVVEKGQLELIGGGWVQPDEAASHYYELIDQYSLGLGILNETFGKCGHPRVAWQIDPFGHSREHANLAALMGYESLFFARQHYLEIEKRAKEKNLELIWSASDDLKTDILTGGFLRGTYGQPDGLCFDMVCNSDQDDPVIDNPDLEGYNVHKKLQILVDYVNKLLAVQRHPHVLVTMGNDFTYSSANMWYESLDKLIAALNERTEEFNMTAFYSTPACYMMAINEAAPHLSVKNDDFFPYANFNNSYWTGYFTSKPVLKGLIRKSSAFLQLIRQFNAFSYQKNSDPRQEVFERAVGLSLHHDAITGTSKENVTRDYERRLFHAWDVGEAMLTDSFSYLAKRQKSSSGVPPQVFCRRLNESVCEITKTEGNLSITVFNGNGQPLNTVIRIPVHRTGLSVKNSREERVPSQISKTFRRTEQLPKSHAAPYELSFVANVPPLGFATYFLTNKSESQVHTINRRIEHSFYTNRRLKNMRSNKTSISNNLIRLSFDSNGFLTSFKDLANNKSYSLRQEFFYYVGMTNGNSSNGNRASGAYIFRPNGTTAWPINRKIETDVIKTSLYQEVRQKVSPWVSQVIRLFPNKSYVEFDYLVGPIPKNESNLTTMEVITRYTISGLSSKGIFKTDANGRQLMERKRNSASSFEYENTEPISANYYPVNSRIMVSDDQTQMTILTDRSHGGSSINDGQIEIMLHRRAYWDDEFGVNEPLDEPGEDGRGLVVRGTHWLLLGPKSSASRAHRPLAFKLFHQPIFSFAQIGSIESYTKKFLTSFSPLSADLPPHINLLTLKQLKGNTLLLRLEHFYQNQEDNFFSQPVSVDLTKLFSPFDIISVQELMLAANKPATSYVRKNGPNKPQNEFPERLLGDFSVELKPMEIKTFRITVHMKSITN